MSPLVSVIMPVFNGAKYIGKAIESVLFQTHSNLELLIINDGSTDETERIVLSYKDERVRYFKQENKGVSSARNVGLRSMSGDFFCFLDADDLFPQNSIKARLMVFETGSSQLEFVDGSIEIIDSDFRRLRLFVPKFSGNPFMELISLRDSCYLKQSWLIKRNSKKDYHMNEDMSHGEDLLFSMEISRFGGLYDYTKELTFSYLKHSSSAMSNLDGLDKSYLQIFQVLKSWEEVSRIRSFLFFMKSRKIMFLSFLFGGRSIVRAIKSLVSWP